MHIYIIMVITSMLFATCAINTGDINISKHSYITFGILSIVPFWAVSCIRYEVGTDWVIYDAFFKVINAGEDKFSEPLFNLLNQILYLFSKESTIVFSVVGFLSLSFTFLAIYKQSVYIPFSILIFFVCGIYFSSMNQLRQELAMSVFLFASQYIKQREWKKYFIIILLAFMIHTSAVLYFFVYFLFGKKVDIRKHATIMVSCIVTLPIIKALMIFIVSKTPYAWYLDSMYNLNEFYLLGFVINLFYLILFEYYAFITKEKDPNYCFFVNMYFIATLCIVFSTFVPQVSRISGIFSIIVPIGIPSMVIKEKNRTRRIFLYIIVVTVFATKLSYDVFKNKWYDVLPYKTIFG